MQSLFESPPNTGVTTRDASEEESQMIQELEKHFGRPDYRLPLTENSEETTNLSEREMMFLVSLNSCQVNAGWLREL